MPKILLVEDDSLLSDMYARKFKSDGYEISLAADGEEGLKKIKEEKPDLVLLDIMMPKMSGLQVLEAVKSDPDKGVSQTPVVLLTNVARDQEDINRGLELGAVTYLVKSQVRPSEVVAKVKEVLAATTPDGVLMPRG